MDGWIRSTCAKRLSAHSTSSAAFLALREMEGALSLNCERMTVQWQGLGVLSKVRGISGTAF